jgi:hypothetical protein
MIFRSVDDVIGKAIFGQGHERNKSFESPPCDRTIRTDISMARHVDNAPPTLRESKSWDAVPAVWIAPLSLLVISLLPRSRSCPPEPPPAKVKPSPPSRVASLLLIHTCHGFVSRSRCSGGIIKTMNRVYADSKLDGMVNHVRESLDRMRSIFFKLCTVVA